MNDEVERHYASRSLFDSVMAAVDALPATGQLKPEDLAALDQFHAGGLAASRLLATLAGLAPGQRVIDVGCGVGGPARFLAEAFGCLVTGIDLTAEYCRIAEALTRRVGLDDKVSFQPANALDLPFADGSFDAAWTQHVAMNIEDRVRFYGEIGRVLKPGGRLAILDIVKGDGGPIIYPAPWASTPEISHVTTAAETRAALAEAGFTELSWVDLTGTALAWISEQRRARDAGAPPPPPQPASRIMQSVGSTALYGCQRVRVVIVLLLPWRAAILALNTAPRIAPKVWRQRE